MQNQRPDDNGMPTIRIVTVPAQEYYKHRITKEEVKTDCSWHDSFPYRGAHAPFDCTRGKSKAKANEDAANCQDDCGEL